MEGYVHSFESFGTVDGPGIRMVVFLQGCPLRCRYCHNPDTWEIGTGDPVTADYILRQYDKNKAFYANGGLTLTGGEPLLQIDFAIELFTKAKAKGIHTCIDTSGGTYRSGNDTYNQKLEQLLSVTDLVMLDLKELNPAKHKDLTGVELAPILEFARLIAEKNVPIWVRHVVVPGITDQPEDLAALGEFMASLKTVKALDVLPYHTLGLKKYEEMGIPYTLKDVPSATKQQAEQARTIILNRFREVRQEMRNQK